MKPFIPYSREVRTLQLPPLVDFRGPEKLRSMADVQRAINKQRRKALAALYDTQNKQLLAVNRLQEVRK